MTTVTAADMDAILHAITVHLGGHAPYGTSLKMPLRLLITGSNGELFAEFEVEIAASGQLGFHLLRPERLHRSTEIRFPISYTVADSAGEKVEGEVSQELFLDPRRARTEDP